MRSLKEMLQQLRIWHSFATHAQLRTSPVQPFANTVSQWVMMGENFPQPTDTHAKHITFSLSVDGNWGEWTHWSTCAVTCGVGEISRERFCDNPAPKFGGEKCNDDGEEIQTEPCAQGAACPRKITPKLKYYFFNKFQNPFQKMVCGVLGNLGTPAVKHVALDLVLGVGLASAQNK